MATRKFAPAPFLEVRQFTVPEIDTGIRKIKRRIDEVQTLASAGVRYDNARVRSAETNIRETVRDVFGSNSPEFRDYEHHDIWDGGYGTYDEEPELQRKFLSGVTQTVLSLEGLISRLEEKRLDLADVSAPAARESSPEPTRNGRRVFIVHGHDHEAKELTARFLEKLKLEPIILSERPSEGRTIIEKFEAHSDVAFAVILLTPDDIGHPRDDPSSARPRARQNVILELGYFIGRLTRARVCALHRGSTDIPSDFHGVLYVSMDDGGGWKLKLATEMKQAGLDVDLNLVI